jgi:hypothetical protein
MLTTGGGGSGDWRGSRTTFRDPWDRDDADDGGDGGGASSDDDLDKLRDFLANLDLLLDRVITSDQYIPNALQEPARAAWSAERWRLEQADQDLADAMNDPAQELRQGLEAVGLSGPSLSFKVAGFTRAWDHFTAVANRRPWSIVRPALKVLLGWANSILGSLSRVVVITEPIKEIKECVEVALDT